MSAMEGVNKSKDEDDLSNEDLVDLNTKKTSESIIQESSDLEISANMAEATTVRLLETSNESGDDIIDILHRDSVQSASTSKDVDNGDGTVTGDTTMTKEVNEESDLGKVDINEDAIDMMIAIDNLKKIQDTEKNSGVLNDEVLNDEDLELRWDEDDEKSTSPDNNAVNSDAHNIDNDLEEVLEKTEMKKQEVSIEPNSTEVDLERNVEEEPELILEEKLLQEPFNTINISENPLTDISLELDENELLQEIQPEDSEMMDIDTSDKNCVISENVKGILKSLDGSSKISEKSLQVITLDAAKIDDESNSSKEVLEISTVSRLEEKTNKITTQLKNINDPYLSNNDDSQELNLSMDVDDNASLENSPVHFKTSHGLSKPDVMLEIPTQELIDFDDVTDSPNDSRNDYSIGKTDDVSYKLAEGDQLDVDNDCFNEGLVDKTLNESVVDQTGAIAKAKEVVIDMKNKENVDNETEADNTNKVNHPDGKDDDEMSLESKTSKCNVEPAAIKSPLIDEAQPSTSTFFPPMTPDTSDEVPEVTDCLGLLAESSRIIDEDEDQEDDDDGDVDEDDDFDQDESSNQMTGEHSEDSNAPHSETEPAIGDLEREIEDREERDADDVETETNQCEEDFTIDEVEIDDDGINGQLRTELKKELGINNIEDGMPVLPDLQNAEQTVEIKKEKNIIPTCVKKEKDSTSISQENIKKEKDSTNISQESVKKEKEDAVHSEVVTEKTKEDTVHSKDVAVQCEEVALQSNDAVRKEKEDVIQLGVQIKKEKEDTTKPRKTFVTKEVMTKDNETLLSSASSVTSNDDVVMQHIEIETVRVSDDEDEEPPKEIQEKMQLETDMTPLLEKTLEGTTALEKVTLLEKVTTLEKTVENTTELEKTAELEKTSPSETTTALEEPSQPEKTTEPDNATIDLTPDQTNIEESHTADGSTMPPESSPGKLKDIVNTNILNTNILSIVELGESSSEDDIQEVTKETLPEHSVSELKKLLESASKPPPLTSKGMTTVNIPTGIDIMSTSGVGGNRTQIVTKEGEVVISGVPKPPPHKPARLNTSEVTIKTAISSEQTLVIPEAKAQEQSQPTPAPTKPKLSLEIFSLDSDEEETTAKAPEPKKPRKKTKKCINSACSSGLTVLQAADIATAAYYDASRKKRPVVCEPCADAVLARKQHLVAGIKNLTPLLQLDTSTTTQDLVEILDSESEDEDSQPQEQQPADTIGEEAAKFLEENLADILNESWKKYNLDERLKETKDELNAEILKLEEESKEINQMLEDCQRVTDKLRLDLYASFEHRIQELPPLLIFETPEFTYMGPDTEDAIPAAVVAESRLSAKRKMVTNNETPAKRPAIPLGYAPLDNSKLTLQENKSVDFKADDDKDISVVKLSAESAPADLPPPGELSRSPLRVGMAVYAMKNAFGPWFRGRVLEIMPKIGNATTFTTCRIKFDHKVKNNGKILPARCIAYADPADVRMTIGTRLIALFKDSNKRESYYSGVVAEIPNPVNNYRYLVFFDDGYAQYVGHAYTRLVCECSPLVWEEVHPLSREFVREYLMAYPERPMVRLHEGQHLKTEWDGKWWSSRVCRVDASLAQVVFLGDGRREWIYRGSTRLAPLYLELRAAERHRPRPMPRSKQPRSNMMPYVEYTRSVEQISKAQETQPIPVALTTQQQNEEIRRQRAVAKKSTSISVLPAAPHMPASAPGVTPGNLDTVTSRVVYYTPKNAVRPYKLAPHKCSPKCKRSDVLSLKELRTYNPLAKPLLSGWERQIVRFKGQKEVMYRAPCGRRLRSMAELHAYLRATESELPVDLFDFYHATHCLAEFVLNKCLVGKKDLSHGKENVPVPCVNYYDDSLPEFCSYNTERTPTSGVPLNLDPEFLCGCDCTDDCEDKSKCACWKMTLEGARTIGLDVANVGYEYKRLPEPLPSGIYECNSRCKCKQTCLNRVAQHPLQLKLQVFKTLNRGWGIRALNDVPKGSFLCVYAGNLLTDATANLDGLNEGDEYLAELDYIEVVEQMKEGYEEDIPDADKKLDKKDGIKPEESDEELSSSSEEDENASKTDKEDDDFRPGYIALGVTDFNKRLRRRAKNKMEIKEEEDKEKENKVTNPEDDCITISDDEEIREPSRFAAKPGMGGNDFISKYSSVRTLFGEDEACYIMDAKVQGNIGRYLNHSCSPNVFVQNVFVDTHDPRFPWVAFFALSHVKAGSELTWNYNYDVGSVPGKILYCYCEAPNCRGRLL